MCCFSLIKGLENIFTLEISLSVVLSSLPGFFKNKSKHSSFVFIKKISPPTAKYMSLDYILSYRAGFHIIQEVSLRLYSGCKPSFKKTIGVLFFTANKLQAL